MIIFLLLQSKAARLSAVLIFMALATSGVNTLEAQTSAGSAGDSLSAEVDRLFERWHRPDSPGAAVLVLRDGKTLHMAGYGMASLEHGIPIRPNSVFDIASVSKQFGAYAIALLEADGLVSMDDDVRKYIPELHDFGYTITLRNLVHHTSGLRDWPGTLRMAGWDYEDIVSFQQILRMAYHQRELNFQPGSEYAYSNTGYNLLAEVVARVSGMSFRAFTEERIFRPRRMADTHFHDDHSEVVPGLADSYRRGPGGAYHRVVNNLTALASSSLFTTVEDLAKWVASFDEPPSIADGAAMARLHERGVLTGGDTLAYAWGQNAGVYRGLVRWNHGGSWAGYRTHLARFPDQRFSVIVLANTPEIDAGSFADEIVNIFLGEALLPQSSGMAVESGIPTDRIEAERWHPLAAELEEYAGEFRSHELQTSYRLSVEDGTLVARHFRTGDRQFEAVSPDRFEANGFGDVHFIRNSSGAVVGFTANQTRIRGLRFERVP